MKDNIIKTRSYELALKIISVHIQLKDSREFILSKQLLRSGTSIGANVEEALQAQSKADFIHKLSISLKESVETHYWLRLLRDSKFIPEHLAQPLITDCEEIQRILTSIIKSAKAKNNKTIVSQSS